MIIVRKKILATVIIFILFFSLTNFSFCEIENDAKEETTYNKEFAIFSGWASGNLKTQDNYEMVPLHLQFGFDINSLLHNINIRPKGSLKFVLEPFLNTILSPDSNIEVGNNFILKYSHPLIQRIHLYFEAGLGLLYTTQHTFEQGTQFNFSEQFGGGVSFLFSKNKALNFGYRYRHFSNLDIEEPNAGIDMDFYLLGISVFY